MTSPAPSQRLLYLCLDDLSRPGAWRTHVHGVTAALVRRGWTVRIAAPGEGKPDVPEGVEGVALPRPSGRLARLGHALFVASGLLAAEMERFRPDAIYTRGVNPLPGWGPALDSGRPLVVEINGYAEEESRPILRGRVAIAHRAAFRRAAAVTTVSAKLRRDLIASHALPPERVFVVGNGADLARFRPLAREECRRRLGWDVGRPVALFVGNFYAHHALEVVVEAAAAVRRTGRDVRFVLAGDGPDRAAVAERAGRLGAAGAVELPGAVPPDRVPDWIGAADVCLLTLRSLRTPERGCSPIKLYEYMACARPVAAVVDSHEVAEEIRSAGAGTARIATGRAADDGVALAQDVLALLDDPGRAASLAAAGRRAAEMRFNWDRAGRRTAEVLDAALGRGAWPVAEET